MTQLQEALAALRAAVHGKSEMPAVLLLYENPREPPRAGRQIVPRSQIRTAEEYEARFDELMQKNYAWIHLSYCGLLETVGLVTVDLPEAPASRPVRTSVNFSGPPRLVLESGCSAMALLDVR